MAVDIWPAMRLGPDECGVMPVGPPIDLFGLVGLDANKWGPNLISVPRLAQADPDTFYTDCGIIHWPNDSFVCLLQANNFEFIFNMFFN